MKNKIIPYSPNLKEYFRILIINVLVVMLIFFNSCKSYKKIDQQQITGVYKYKVPGAGELMEYEITLNDDGTFKYYWYSAKLDGTTNGKWEIQNNKILLNSEFQPRDKVFENQHKVLKKGFNRLDSIQIKVLNESNQPLEGVLGSYERYPFSSTGSTSNSTGIIKLPKIGADSLFLSQDDFYYVSIPINEIESDDFTFVLNNLSSHNLRFYHFFTNEKLRFRGNQIKLESIKYSKVE